MGTPNYPKNFASEWTQLKRDVKNAYTSANLRKGMAKIGAKVIEITGELVMNAGASLKALYSNGSEALHIGRFFYGETPVEGFRMQRPNGTLMFEGWGTADGPDGFYAFRDKQGNIIISEDGASGIGLARPYIGYQTVRTFNLTTPQDLSTSTSYAPHHSIINEMQHPRIRVFGYVYCNGSDVAQIRLRDGGGNVIAQSGNITSGWFTLEGNHPNYVFGDFFQYDLDIRRVSGTSTGVGVTPVYAMGIQT